MAKTQVKGQDQAHRTRPQASEARATLEWQRWNLELQGLLHKDNHQGHQGHWGQRSLNQANVHAPSTAPSVTHSCML
jgi:hypothetical protein